jgi:hypothetical protein
MPGVMLHKAAVLDGKQSTRYSLSNMNRALVQIASPSMDRFSPGFARIPKRFRKTGRPLPFGTSCYHTSEIRQMQASLNHHISAAYDRPRGTASLAYMYFSFHPWECKVSAGVRLIINYGSFIWSEVGLCVFSSEYWSDDHWG